MRMRFGMRYEKEELDRFKNYLRDLSVKYNVGVVFDDSVGDNEGSTDGFDIYLGNFDCVQKMFFAYFHEVSHLQLKREIKELFRFNTYTVELLCWSEALKESARNNIFYEDEVIKWGFEKANSYCGFSKRELIKECYEEEFGDMLNWERKILENKLPIRV